MLWARILEVFVDDSRVVNDDALVDQGRYLADRIYRKILGFLMLAGWQIKPRRLPLEPFFQKGDARLARIRSGLIVKHLQHWSILFDAISICKRGGTVDSRSIFED